MVREHLEEYSGIPLETPGKKKPSRRLRKPLCRKCGAGKRGLEPEEIEVYSPIYFTQPPSDAYEGLFW